MWGWLIGPFVSAHLRVYGDKAAARSFLDSLLHHHIRAHVVGSISEIFDGDAPFNATRLHGPGVERGGAVAHLAGNQLNYDFGLTIYD